MSNDSFYIGWQGKSPAYYSKYTRPAVFILVTLMFIGAATLAWLQRPFDSGVFEYGKLTRVKGVYQESPVPSLMVRSIIDASGNFSNITIPLVGYGKFGALGIIRSIEKARGIKLNGNEVELNGTLIYYDGKTLLQIDQHEDFLVTANPNTKGETIKTIDLGQMRLTGEVLDPKCYFGVMKPGHGKPHRDCAVRCIEGGIHPVFHMRNENGDISYALLFDELGNSINPFIMDYVGEPVTLDAKVFQYEDWLLLYVNKESVRRTGGLSWFKKDGLISCRPVKN